MKSIQERLAGLDELLASRLGTTVNLMPIPGAVPVIQATIGGREELPIYITASADQTLCICYLWAEAEIRPDRRTELLEAMLDLNMPIPLSAFGRVDGRYVLFGALSHDARVEDIVQDLAALSDNAVDALEAFSDYLV